MNAHADLKETKYFTITDSEFYDNSFTCIIICKQTLSNNSISNGIFGVWISHTLNEIDWRDGKLKKKEGINYTIEQISWNVRIKITKLKDTSLNNQWNYFSKT